MLKQSFISIPSIFLILMFCILLPGCYPYNPTYIRTLREFGPLPPSIPAMAPEDGRSRYYGMTLSGSLNRSPKLYCTTGNRDTAPDGLSAQDPLNSYNTVLALPDFQLSLGTSLMPARYIRLYMEGGLSPSGLASIAKWFSAGPLGKIPIGKVILSPSFGGSLASRSWQADLTFETPVYNASPAALHPVTDEYPALWGHAGLSLRTNPATLRHVGFGGGIGGSYSPYYFRFNDGTHEAVSANLGTFSGMAMVEARVQGVFVQAAVHATLVPFYVTADGGLPVMLRFETTLGVGVN